MKAQTSMIAALADFQRAWLKECGWGPTEIVLQPAAFDRIALELAVNGTVPFTDADEVEIGFTAGPILIRKGPARWRPPA